MSRKIGREVVGTEKIGTGFVGFDEIWKNFDPKTIVGDFTFDSTSKRFDSIAESWDAF